jgi:allantoate deiminase
VRHASDEKRVKAFDSLMGRGRALAATRGIRFSCTILAQQPAVTMDAELTKLSAAAIEGVGVPVHRMMSGAGHDAMILARRFPTSMIFLRSPGGVSHHPEETVLEDDVELALRAGMHFVRQFGAFLNP